MAFTTEGAIYDLYYEQYGVDNVESTKQYISLVWGAWPGIAAQVGAYRAENAKDFVSALSGVLPQIPLVKISLIAKVIATLGQRGKIAQKFLDPNNAHAIQVATEAATGGSFLSKLNPFSGIANTISANKGKIVLGAVALGIIVLLWVGRPYIKMASGLFKKKEADV